jgi:hypothetical protein
VKLGVRPAAPPVWRYGHHHPAIGMDHDPESTGTWRSPEGVIERTAGQAQRGWGLGDGHIRMVPRWRT